MPQFAANLSFMFTERPFAQRFQAAADAGFAAVEYLFPYDHPPAQIAGWLRDAGLRQVLFNLPAGDFEGGERGLAGLPAREEDFRRSVDLALTYADVLEVPRVHCMAGLRSAGAERGIYERRLAYAAERLAEAGKGLLIEPINGRDMPGYLLDEHELALDVITAVGAPNLRLQCDLYHLQIIAGDVSTRLRRDVAAIGHVQVAAVPDRSEPDRGELNYRHLFALLDELEYRGWVGCEYRPRGRTEDGLGWLRTVAEGGFEGFPAD